MTKLGRFERLQAAAATRAQDLEFHKALLAVLEQMPEGSTVDDALASPEGIRASRKWELKYGRAAPSVPEPDSSPAP